MSISNFYVVCIELVAFENFCHCTFVLNEQCGLSFLQLIGVLYVVTVVFIFLLEMSPLLLSLLEFLLKFLMLFTLLS